MGFFVNFKYTNCTDYRRNVIFVIQMNSVAAVLSFQTTNNYKQVATFRNFSNFKWFDLS
jgi:hypothetical protein